MVIVGTSPKDRVGPDPFHGRKSHDSMGLSSSFGPLEVEIFGPTQSELRICLTGPGFKMPFPMLGTGGEEGRMGGWLVERRGQSTLN